MDREKVIKGLERCKLYNKVNCDKCPYDYNGRGDGKSECTAELATDALALLKEQREEIENLKQVAQSMMEGICLLKEQEAVKPILVREGRNKWYNDYRCPICDQGIAHEQNYCSECGRAVKWE